FYNSNEKGFKYYFVVHPGADPNQIKLLYRSKEKCNIDKTGNIQIETSNGSLTELAPVCYIQETKKNIESKFQKLKVTTCNPTGGDVGYETEFSFDLEIENLNLIHETIIIDPQLFWATLYGGNSGDVITEITCNAAGDLYAAGTTKSSNFPLLTLAGAYFDGTTSATGNSNANGGRGDDDIFILKFTNSGVLMWSTFYGGSYSENAIDIVCDRSDNLYITGYTNSTDFPTQNRAGAFNQLTIGSVLFFGTDIFILRFDNSGVRTWATYYGSTGVQKACAIACDNANNIYITGTASSYAAGAFPTTPRPGAYNYAGSGYFDCLLLRFNSAGALTWATLYGGTNVERPFDIDCDASGNVYVTGSTQSKNIPTQPWGVAYFQANNNSKSSIAETSFLLRFDNTGVLTWATYCGGTNDDFGIGVACDLQGNVYMGIEALSTNLPCQPWGSAYYISSGAGSPSGFLIRFNPLGVITWGTYCSAFFDAGSGYPTKVIKPDNCGNLYVAYDNRTSKIGNQNCGNNFDFQYVFQGGCNFDCTLSIGTLFKFNNNGILLNNTITGGAFAIDNTGGLFVSRRLHNMSYTCTPGPAFAGANPKEQSDIFPYMNPGNGAYFDNSHNGQIGGVEKLELHQDAYIMKFIPVVPNFSQSQINSTNCSSCNGIAVVKVDCADAPYSYIWSTGQSTLNTTINSDTIKGLCAGTYTVTVTDGACQPTSKILTFTITNGGAVPNISTISPVAMSCASTSIKLTGSSTTPGVTYLWQGPGILSGGTTATPTINAAGTYTLVVTDGNGCKSMANVVVNQPSISIVANAQWSCSSNSGLAGVTAANGIPPYLYTWSNAQTTQTATGLNTGAYSVTVTDANGCSKSASVSVAINPPTINITGTNINCSIGSLSASVSGGIPPYLFNWSNGQTVPSLNYIGAGTYTLSITDGLGCITTKSSTITNTGTADASFTQSPTSVCAGTTATFDFINTGTTGNDVWKIWIPNNPIPVYGYTKNFSYTGVVPNLPGWTYTIEHVVKIGSCTNTVSSTITIINCNGPTVAATGSSVCPGSCSTVSSTGSGGTSPYTYSWSTGASTQNINPCPTTTTTYTVKVTDAGGNTATTTAVVTVNPAVTVTATSTNITCSGTSTGSVTATPAGGTPTFNYVWNNGITTPTDSNLAAGNYTVTVIDSKGCTAVSTTTIAAPPALLGQYTKGTANCSTCGCKEWIMLNATGGTSPYAYTWPDGYDKRYKNALCPGAYNVIVTDNNGCKTTVKVNAP
ncbi:MAG: SBBP repeat-containing protein, partial [Bacteroidia bacterium]|nr:SBBP repeat-containing protein [Bacteroidia bacterium]